MAGATGVYWIDRPGGGRQDRRRHRAGAAKGLPTPARLRRVLAAAVGARAGGRARRRRPQRSAFNGDIVTHRPAEGPGPVVRPAPSWRAAAARGCAQARRAGRPDRATTGPRPAAAGFLARYDALMAPVADEEGKGLEGPTAGHMALARFLVGEELVVRGDRRARTTPCAPTRRWAATRSSAACAAWPRSWPAATRRPRPTSPRPVLEDDPAASLWRGYVAGQAGQWADAKKASPRARRRSRSSRRSGRRASPAPTPRPRWRWATSAARAAGSTTRWPTTPTPRTTRRPGWSRRAWCRARRATRPARSPSTRRWRSVADGRGRRPRRCCTPPRSS